MTQKTHIWLKSLGAAAVTGCASSFLSALGIKGAEVIGVQVSQLDPRQLIVITAMGGLIGVAAYLKQSPVPPEQKTLP